MVKSQRRFLALVQKEIIQLLHDRYTLGIIVSIPLIELFLFAYAVDLTVDHIPTAVADMSRDGQSQALIDAFVVSGAFDVTLYADDQAAVVRAIDQGLVRAGLVIPPDLTAQLERQEAQVLILLDGSDSFTVQSGYGAAVAIAQARSMAVAQEQFNRLGVQAVSMPIQSATRVLYNPTLDDMIFILPGMAAMLLQIMAVNVTALAVVREREMGTIEQLLITPIRPVELLLGKLLPNAIISALTMLTIILLGIFWFDVPFRGNAGLFAWLSLLFLVSGLGLGLLISTLARNQKEAQQITMLLLLLSLLLTGFIYPRGPMPAPIHFIGNLIPLTYFVRITRAIYTKGVGLSFLWSDVFALVIYGLVIMLAAAGTFRKRLD